MPEVQNLPIWNDNEQYKVILTFDNNLTYTANTNSTTTVITSVDLTESSSITSGNPTGILEPNYLNLKLVDFSNSLLATNASSPYYGYMRNGVKVELLASYDGGDFEPLGVYYTDGWESEKTDGCFSEVSLSCVDKLEYIGNMELPPLPAYSGVNVVNMLENIFYGIGLTDDDFNIDDSLSLTMLYAVTKSTTVRDALNSISQALLACVYIDRRGVIQVKPTMPTRVIKWNITDAFIENFKVQHNRISQYNKVKLLYNKIDDRPSDTILELNNTLIQAGANNFTNLQINSNVLSIDGVFLTSPSNEEVDIDFISSINYTAYQGGIDIEIVSNLEESITVNLIVVGRITGITDAYVESVVTGSDTKVGNTLILENSVIQDMNVAQNYVNNVALYLSAMGQEVVFSGALCSKLQVQDYINIISTDGLLNGTYLITGLNIVDGEAYSLSATAVKMR